MTLTKKEIFEKYFTGERYFRGADLRSADLSWANLSSADLSWAKLPAPTTMLMAIWGSVSDDLCVELMRYDASNHPDPMAFDRWVETGMCPYSNAGIQRCANFRERKELWSPGSAKSALELMIMLIREKCADSDYHDHEGDDK